MTLHSPHIRKEVDLSAFNTLGIHATAAGYIEITHRDQLPVLARRGLFNRGKSFILGGGSNVLFKDRLEVTVIRINIPEIREEQLQDRRSSEKGKGGDGGGDQCS